MRLRGTGKDPDHKYPEGLVFDAPPHAARKLVDEGYATTLDPKDDPGRTESQIAAAVERGDNLNDPTDAALAAGIDNRDALATVHGEPIDEPVPGGAEARAPIGKGPEELPATSGLANEAPTSAPASGGSDSGSSSEAPKELTPKQKAVERAKELDVSHSGSQAEIEERIAAKEKELADANAAPSDEVLQRAQELEVDTDGTAAEVEARIAAKEQEIAGQGSSS